MRDGRRLLHPRAGRPYAPARGYCFRLCLLPPMPVSTAFGRGGSFARARTLSEILRSAASLRVPLRPRWARKFREPLAPDVRQCRARAGGGAVGFPSVARDSCKGCAGRARAVAKRLRHPTATGSCEPRARPQRGDCHDLARGERRRSFTEAAGRVIPLWITSPAKVPQKRRGPGFSGPKRLNSGAPGRI